MEFFKIILSKNSKTIPFNTLFGHTIDFKNYTYFIKIKLSLENYYRKLVINLEMEDLKWVKKY